MNLPISTNQDLTMSSRDIADLTGKRHDNVMADTEKLLIELGISTPEFSGVYKASNNQEYKCFNLPKRECLILVSGYSVLLRSKIIDRWQELENSKKPKWMAQLSKEAVIAINDLSNQLGFATEEIDRLQGVCNTISAQFSSGTTAPVFCRQLNGVNLSKVNGYLVSAGMLIRTKRGLEPSSYSRDRYFKVKYNTFTKPNKEDGHKANTTLTLKGAKWLYRAYISDKLPMKNNWDGKRVHIEFNQEVVSDEKV